MMKIKTEILKLLVTDFSGNLPEYNISFDSRTISKGDLFIALNGENFKAAKFVSKAFIAGASYAVVNSGDKDLVEKKYLDKCFFVEDTTVFIKKLSTLSLDSWRQAEKVVIGITGSNGKTSTKELLVYMLNNLNIGNVRGTEGNLNNHIGVPMSVFKLNKSDQIAVFEIGTNNFGEIKYLSEIIKPDASIITCIGQSHLESFGNEEAVYKEKIDLFYETLDQSSLQKCCFFHSKDKYLGKFDNKDRCFISGDLSSGLEVRTISNDSVEFALGNATYNFNFNHLFGQHHYLNFLNCFSLILKTFEVEAEKILASAQDFKLGAFRGEWKLVNEFNCFLDCYNSNPSSLRASIDSFIGKYPEKVQDTLFVIGDMYELGDLSDKYHEEAGAYFRELALENVVFIGERAKPFEKGFRKGIKHFKKVEDVTASQLELGNISTLYLKGSRGVQLEKLLKIFNK